MNPVAMATPAVGILTAPTAVSIRRGPAGSWEGVARRCGQMLALGPAALSWSPVSQLSPFPVNSLNTIFRPLSLSRAYTWSLQLHPQKTLLRVFVLRQTPKITTKKSLSSFRLSASFS